MEEFLTNLLSESQPVDATTAVSTDPTLEEMAWGVTDVLLDTGAAEGAAVFLGAPVAVVLGIRVFRRWRKDMKEKQMMGKRV